jgi:hypothetical protein
MISRLTVLFGTAFFIVATAAAARATDYDIDFKLTNANPYTAIQFKVNYTSAPGAFSGSGGSVACTANSSLNSLAAFNPTSPYLKGGFIATTAFTGPVVLATCIFSSTGGAPTVGQFSISIDDYLGSPSPSVSISRIALH